MRAFASQRTSRRGRSGANQNLAADQQLRASAVREQSSRFFQRRKPKQ
jgi:hypothetical protein